MICSQNLVKHLHHKIFVFMPVAWPPVMTIMTGRTLLGPQKKQLKPRKGSANPSSCPCLFDSKLAFALKPLSSLHTNKT